jgi:hypothetical protein
LAFGVATDSAILQTSQAGAYCGGLASAAFGNSHVNGIASFGHGVGIAISHNRCVAFGRNIVSSADHQSLFGFEVAPTADVVHAIGKGTPGAHAFEVLNTGGFNTFGSQKRKVTHAEDVTVNATSANDIIIFDQGNSVGDVLLPSIVADGQQFTVVNKSGSAVPINTQGPDLTDFGGSVAAGNKVTFISDLTDLTWTEI